MVPTLLAFVPMLAQARDDGSGVVVGVFGGLLALVCTFFLLLFVLEVIIAWMAHKLLAAVPPEYRRQDPSMAWLLLIPFFNIVWNFFVWPKISESYENYFKAQGQMEVGNANSSLAWATCICLALAWLPYVGWFCLTWCAIIVLIIYLVKMFGLKSRILPRATAE